MRRLGVSLLRKRPGINLWLALAVAWIAAIAALLLRQPIAAAALTIGGPVLVATWGLAPLRNAFLGERHKLAALLNAVPEGVLEIDAAGRILFANSQLCELFGYLPQELTGQSVEVLVPPQQRQGHADRRAAFWNSSRSRPMGSNLDIHGVRKDGSLVAVDVSLTRVDNRRGAVMYCLVRDNTARHAFESRLVDSNRRLTDSVARLERNSLELQVLTDMGELLHSSNTEPELHGILAHTMQRLFPGWSGALYMLGGSRTTASIGHAWGERASAMKAVIAGDDCWAWRRGRPHHSVLPTDQPRCSHEASASTRCSHCIPLLAQGELMGVLHLSEDAPQAGGEASATPRLQLLQALANQVALSTANLRLRDTLRAQSTIDPLTGLHNRRVVDERFESIIRKAGAERRDVALLVLDIDHFKSFNDRLGHECGDIVLREIGALLRRNLRHDDLACRLGGEEFVILLPDIAPAESERVAEKLRQAVDELRPQRNGHSLGRISVSIGIATLGVHGDTADALIRHADRALYRAKAAGRNCVMVSSANDSTGLHPRLARVQLQA